MRRARRRTASGRGREPLAHEPSDRDGAVAEPACGEHRSIGSSLKFCLVAEAEADFYPRLGPTMEWDTAAGDAVLRAAGGAVVTLDGEPLRYGKVGVAGNAAVREPVFPRGRRPVAARRGSISPTLK